MRNSDKMRDLTNMIDGDGTYLSPRRRELDLSGHELQDGNPRRNYAT